MVICNLKKTLLFVLVTFSQDIIFDETDDEFEMDLIFLDDLKISDFEMVDNRIQIFR